MSGIKHSLKVDPKDVAKYILLRAANDGELISPLKMQKLVYYSYSWVLAKLDKRLFDEKIEAWPNGPVVRSLYTALKDYGSGPIPEEWAGETFEHVKKRLPKEAIDVLELVYESYANFTAFQLTTLTHEESPWKEARRDCGPLDKSTNKISDELIIKEYKSRLNDAQEK